MDALDKMISALSEHVINPLIILLFAIALLTFLWGLLEFIRKAADPAALETAKRHVLYGILGMFIMVSAFGLIHLITDSFGIDTTQNLDTLE